MSWVTLFITVPLTVMTLVFTVSNTADVDVALTPFDPPMTVPLYAVVLAALAIGFFCGAGFVWVQSTKIRMKRWKETRRANSLEKELAEEKERKSTAVQDNARPALPTASEALAARD